MDQGCEVAMSETDAGIDVCVSLCRCCRMSFAPPSSLLPSAYSLTEKPANFRLRTPREGGFTTWKCRAEVIVCPAGESRKKGTRGIIHQKSHAHKHKHTGSKESERERKLFLVSFFFLYLECDAINKERERERGKGERQEKRGTGMSEWRARAVPEELSGMLNEESGKREKIGGQRRNVPVDFGSNVSEQ